MNFTEWFFKTKPTIAYLTVGYPSFEESLNIGRFLLSNNYVQIIEAGIPFSDPIADGEVIQYSTHIALQNGITLKDVARFINILKGEFNNPIFAMGYYNPIFANISDNLSLLKNNGCDGLIIPDINVEEIKKIKVLIDKNDLMICGFVAPNTPEERMKDIVKYTTGFVYLVSSYGTTGIRDEIDFSYLRKVVYEIKSIKNIPVAIGFGIKDFSMIKSAKEIS
ncbi:MAG: tryptophan synthase subunit alpha, partial [Brevinematia bacterium]